jgi:hypothetical protein
MDRILQQKEMVAAVVSYPAKNINKVLLNASSIVNFQFSKSCDSISFVIDVEYNLRRGVGLNRLFAGNLNMAFNELRRSLSILVFSESRSDEVYARLRIAKGFVRKYADSF